MMPVEPEPTSSARRKRARARARAEPEPTGPEPGPEPGPDPSPSQAEPDQGPTDRLGPAEPTSVVGPSWAQLVQPVVFPGRAYGPGMQFRYRIRGDYVYLQFEGTHFEERVPRATFQEGVHYRSVPGPAGSAGPPRARALNGSPPVVRASWVRAELHLVRARVLTDPDRVLATVQLQLPEPGVRARLVLPIGLIQLAPHLVQRGLYCLQPVQVVQFPGPDSSQAQLELVLHWTGSGPLEHTHWTGVRPLGWCWLVTTVVMPDSGR
jgi:hypothetical protein